MKNTDKQKISELEHREFFDFMYPYFSLEKNPGYRRIIVKPLLFAGALGRSSTIYLDSMSSPEKRRYSNWHESSHFLNYMSDSTLDLLHQKIDFDGEGNPTLQKILVEMVADLGALIFLYITEGLDQESINKYELGPDMNNILSPEEINALFNIAKKDKGLLKTLAKGGDERGLVELVRSYS